MFNGEKVKIVKLFRFYTDKFHLSLVVFAILIAVLYTYSAEIGMTVIRTDFFLHAKAAENMMSGGRYPPHFLYQLILIGVHKLLGTSFLNSSLIFTFIIVFFTFIIATKGVFKNSNTFLKNSFWILIAITFLFLSHPIAFLFPYDKHFYCGYVVSNVYHNPTILLLKFIALLHFTLMCNLLICNQFHRYVNSKIFLLALFTALTIIAKPSYIITLLPAIFVLFLIQNISKRWEGYNFFVVILGIVIPAMMILLWQYNFFYGAGSPNSIGFGFLEVYSIKSQAWTLVPKLLASMAFPISVIAVMRLKLINQLEFQLSALMLLFALIYSYVLVDNVNGVGGSGNFWWSAQITNFIFLFVCIKYYLHFILNIENEYKKDIKLKYIPVYIAVVQFLFGVVWYLINVIPSIGGR